MIFDIGFQYKSEERVMGASIVVECESEGIAKKYLVKQMLSRMPDWIKRQVDVNFESTGPYKVYCEEIKTIKI